MRNGRILVINKKECVLLSWDQEHVACVSMQMGEIIQKRHLLDITLSPFFKPAMQKTFI